MKICHITNYYPNIHKHSGGAEQLVFQLVNLLESNGLQNFILTKKPDFKISINDKKFFFIPTIEDYLIPIKKLLFYSEVLKWYILQFDPIVYRHSLKILRKIKPNVIHLHNFQFLTFSVIAAAKKFNIPVCLTIYDYWYFCPITTLYNEKKGECCREFHNMRCIKCLPPKFKVIQKLLLLLRKKLFDFFLNKIDAFITLSNSSKNILMDYGIDNNKIEIIPLIIDIPSLSNQVEEENFILFAGWIQKRKGLHILLKAMPDILQKLSFMKLYIVGDYVKYDEGYSEDIKNLIKELNLEKNIVWLGKKPHNEVLELIKKSKVVVVPEQWENMSPVLIAETMLLGKPIVASNVGGIPEFIVNDETGLLANHNEPKDFTKKIIWILENETEAEKIGKNAKEAAILIFDNNKNYSKLISLYKSLS